MYSFRESDILLDLNGALDIVRNGIHNLDFTEDYHGEIGVFVAGDDAAWGFTAKNPFAFLIENVFDSPRHKFFDSLFAREKL